MNDVSVEYVRLVLVNVEACERGVGDAQVVINLRDGRKPSYRIEAVMDLETGETMIWQAFSGRTHRPLTDRQEKEAIWSSVRMTWREVSALIGEMRKLRKARATA